MGYSEALEQQVATLRWMQSSAGREWVKRADVVAREHGDTYEWSPELVAGRMLLPLAEGETYFWSRPIVACVEQAASDLPNVMLTDDLLPSRDGFCLFDKPFGVFDPDVQMVGLTWTLGLRQLEGVDDRPVRSIYLTFWGRVRDYEWHVTPMGGESWDIGVYLDDEVAYSATLGNETFAIRVLKFFASMLLFVRQRILVTPQRRAERHAVKRLERDGWTHEPLIRVVELRRKASQSQPSDDPKMVAWSHQWVVSGHWHQYWVGSEDKKILQPRWLMPYVKGPEDKPLKPPRAKVFAVVR